MFPIFLNHLRKGSRFLESLYAWKSSQTCQDSSLFSTFTLSLDLGKIPMICGAHQLLIMNMLQIHKVYYNQ